VKKYQSKKIVILEFCVIVNRLKSVPSREINSILFSLYWDKMKNFSPIFFSFWGDGIRTVILVQYGFLFHIGQANIRKTRSCRKGTLERFRVAFTANGKCELYHVTTVSPFLPFNCQLLLPKVVSRLFYS